MPKVCGGRDDNSHRDAFDGQPDGVPLASLEHGDDRREPLEAGEDRRGIFGGADHREVVDELAEAASRAGHLALQSSGDRLRQGSTATERQSARSLRPTLQRGLDLRLGRGAHARSFAQPPGGDRILECRNAVDVESAGDSQHALGGEPERPPVAHQLRLYLRLERLQLGDVARLHELAKLGLDARADAAELADPARAHELGDGRRCRANELGRPHVRAHGERIRLRELQKGGEEREPIGDLGVRQACPVGPHFRKRPRNAALG